MKNNNKSFVAYEDFTFGLWAAIVGLCTGLIVSLRRLVIREHEHFWLNIDKKLDKRDRAIRKDFSEQMDSIKENIHSLKTSEAISNGALFQIEETLKSMNEKMSNEKK